MALMKRTRDELDWPTWFGRRLVEWPEAWRDMFEESDMKVEEFQEDDHMVVRAEMPGIDPDKDVEITLDHQMLHLRAERRSETKTEDAKGYRSEFRYGAFERTVPLPVGATEADVTATYTDGILEVRIPVDATKAETKRITVSRG
jgi:HSP20 family protein